MHHANISYCIFVTSLPRPIYSNIMHYFDMSTVMRLEVGVHDAAVSNHVLTRVLHGMKKLRISHTYISSTQNSNSRKEEQKKKKGRTTLAAMSSPVRDCYFLRPALPKSPCYHDPVSTEIIC